jgi:methylmalonyl-CoA mutase, C-terminal domain
MAVPDQLLNGGARSPRPRVLVAKTSLDGHWRGVNVVAHALRDGGFEVILLGMATADVIARVAADEDVALIGLNVGGRVEVVERILDTLAAADVSVPVIAGGTIPHYAAERLGARGVACFPPGSALEDIVTRARELTAGRSRIGAER